jgi:geranylgeranyl diphosphate synthase, type I
VPNSLPNLAKRYLDALDHTMRDIAATAPKAPEFNTLIEYPLGWVNEQGEAYISPTGKRIRPILLLLSVEAAGGSWESGLPAAAAVEILHNFSLIHDDIQDDSPTRHNRPTVWKIWGRSFAINAGDALFTLAYSALAGLSKTGIAPETVLEIWDVFNRTNLELTRGQHLDMRFETQTSVTVDEYISMITGKSAALVACCAQIGALVGSGDSRLAAHFAAFGLNLGIAFQIRDDILGIWGDPSVTGKSAATDILSKKKSLPVLYGLANSPSLVKLYRKKTFNDTDVIRAIASLDECGALAHTQQLEREYYDCALQALDASGIASPAAEGMRQLAVSLFGRAQ